MIPNSPGALVGCISVGCSQAFQVWGSTTHKHKAVLGASYERRCASGQPKQAQATHLACHQGSFAAPNQLLDQRDQGWQRLLRGRQGKCSAIWADFEGSLIWFERKQHD